MIHPLFASWLPSLSGKTPKVKTHNNELSQLSMSYGWCRPCTSWDVYDGESLLEMDETVVVTPDTVSGLKAQGSSNVRENYMDRGDKVLSSISNDIDSKDSLTQTQNDSQFRIIECDNPYKIEYFERQLFQQEPSESRKNVVLNALKELGVKAYIVDEMAVKNTSDVIFHVNNILTSIEQENTAPVAGRILGAQRCLLFQDHQSRLFNLVFSTDSTGQRRLWEEHLESFSTIRAVSALVILLRSFPGLFLSKLQLDSTSFY